MLLAPSPDYTDKDFDAIRLRLQNLIRSVFPEWTDFNVANFGNLLVELFAFVGDVLGFYQDNQARQSRIVTATQRRALLGLVKLLGFKPATATAARAVVTISLSAPPIGIATFPAGTVISTDEVTAPIEYRLLVDAVIQAGANPPAVAVLAENSEPHQDAFASNGTANQQFVLSSTPFIDQSVVLIAGLDPFDEVDNFLASKSTDRHFTVVVDENDRATIRFGNGINGQIPIGTISISYKTGGGSGGRVDSGKLRRVEGSFQDSTGHALSPSVTNSGPSSGGTDRASVAQIKVDAPASIRAPRNCVAKEDFEIHARDVPGVARALMLTKNEDPSVPENAGILYPVPIDGGAPGQAMKGEIKTRVTVTFPCTLTFNVYVQDPAYRSVDVYALVFLRQGANPATVRAAILASLTAFFAILQDDETPNPLIDFGANIRDVNGEVTGEIAYSDVFNVVRDTSGVRKIGSGAGDFLLGGKHDDVVLLPREFPVLGTVTIVNGNTGAPL